MCSKICIVLIATRIVFVSLQSCQYVFEFGVNYREVGSPKAPWKLDTVTGCINDTVFEGKKIVAMYLLKASLPKLEQNFVSNMRYLKEINIEKFHIEAIEPGAFSNLPQLEKINMNKNLIKTIVRGVFDVLPSLQVIQIYQSNLSFIEDHAFANLPNLKHVSLNENNFDHVRKEWFTNTSNIEYFNMFYNSIRKIPLGMFHGWKKLDEIHLNSNAISVIEGELFKDNPSFLTNVAFHHNRLTSISLNTFPESVYMKFFSISANLLNYLPEDFLKKVQIGHIGIYGNPFSCPCRIKIQKILLRRGITIDNIEYTYSDYCTEEEVPVCGFSLNSSSICTEAVDEDLTRRFISYLKNIHYDTVQDPNEQQCAMFDVLNESISE